MMRVAKIGNIVGVEYLYWGTTTDVEEAEKFFEGEKDWKACKYYKENDPNYEWVNLMHDGDIIPYKTYIVKTMYGIITMNKLAFETLFVKI